MKENFRISKLYKILLLLFTMEEANHFLNGFRFLEKWV